VKERRKVKRKDLLLYARVFEQPSGRLLGHLQDLSPKGAMVISSTPLAEGTGVSLKVELADRLGLSGQDLLVDARLVWCRPDLDPSYHNLGFEFSRITPAQGKLIRAVLEAYEFRREPPGYPPAVLPEE
jgi:hypothetical protein